MTEENIDEHTCIENDEAYPFEMVGNIIHSTNKNHSTESFLTITATEDMTVMFEYKTSSESGCDRLIISLNGSGVAECSGITSYEQKKVLLSAGDTLTFSYYKDGSASNGDDCAYIKNLAFVFET